MNAAPLRVLITTDSVGGVWQYSVDLAGALAIQGWQPIIAHMGPPPSDAQRAQAASVSGAKLIETGLPLDWLCDTPADVLDAGAAITQLAHDERAGLLHLNSPALGASAPSGIRTVAVAHGCLATWWSATKPGEPFPDAYRWHRQLTSEGLRSATRVVAPSRSYARQIARTYGLTQTPIAVYNGRRRLTSGATVGHDFAFTVGRLWDKAKRTSLLDRAAGLLPIPFHAAGPLTGPHGETVACDNLHTLGVLDEAALGDWLSRRPVFVSAAAFEPFGLAVLEAAAAGCPLVLSDIPTFRELWDGAAVFAEHDSPQVYAWAIDALIADPPFRRALGTAAAARAANYTVEAMGAAMQRVYAATLGLGLEGRAA